MPVILSATYFDSSYTDFKRLIHKFLLAIFSGTYSKSSVSMACIWCVLMRPCYSVILVMFLFSALIFTSAYFVDLNGGTLLCYYLCW